MKQIIKEQVKAQVSKIMPHIRKYVTESPGAEVLVRSDIQKNLYNALIEAYNSDKDIFTSYGDVVTLKRGRDYQEKDEDPSVRSDQGTERRKSSKDAEPSKGLKSMESKLSSSSKGTQSQHKSSSKSTQAEEPKFKAVNMEMHQDQGNESSHIDYQPYNEAATQYDWFQKPDKPPTLDRAWNKSKSVDFRPPLKWISTIAKECREHPFDLSKPLLLIEDQGRQVVLADYFINNDLEYLKGGSSSSKCKKLFNLDVDDWYDLRVVLRMFTRRIVNIFGIDPEFCSHKILLEEDYSPKVQSQRRVIPKIHDVIKKEVEKLLDAGLIYPISDSPWVSPIHCVPKKGGMTVIKNDENELVPTRLIIGWRVCIDYRKLNEATRKDHFLLPFMD
nr:reverse transcriptase domain-containing protein [Tanacetum cinerariifolium]